VTTLDAGAGFVLLLVLFVGYFLPSIVALLRSKKNPGVVIVINLFFGWTVIGWIIALAMAFGEAKSPPPPKIAVAPQTGHGGPPPVSPTTTPPALPLPSAEPPPPPAVSDLPPATDPWQRHSG
jgi:hypothetical protein